MYVWLFLVSSPAIGVPWDSLQGAKVAQGLCLKYADILTGIAKSRHDRTAVM